MPVSTRMQVNDCVEVTWLMETPDSFVSFTAHYATTTVLTPTILQGMAAYSRDLWHDHFGPMCSNTVSLVAIRVADMDVPTNKSLDFGVNPAMFGEDTNEALPSQVAATIRWKTGFAGKSYRGRMHLVGLTIGDIVDNTLTTGYQFNMTQWASALMSMSGQANFGPMVVASVTHGEKTDIIAYVAVPYTTTQRTRAKGVGR